MKSLYLFSLFALFCAPLWSQSFSKQLLFPDTSANAVRWHQDLFPTSDGGYFYAAGDYNLDAAVLLCKFTADGELTWATELYLQEEYWFALDVDVIETQSGGAMVHLEMERENLDRRTHIVKLDSEGTLEFSFELPIRPSLFSGAILSENNRLFRFGDQYLLTGIKFLNSHSSVVICLAAWNEDGVVTNSETWKVGNFDRLYQSSISLGQNNQVQLACFGSKAGDQDTITDGTILFSVDVNDWETASCSFHPDEKCVINDIASDENGWYYIFDLDNTILIDTSTIAHFDYEGNLKWSQNMHNVSGLVTTEDALLARREDTLDMVTLAALSKGDGTLLWNSVLWDFISYPLTYKPVELAGGGILWMGYNYNKEIHAMVKMDAQGQIADCNNFARCDLETLPPSPLPDFEPIEITSIPLPEQVPVTITSRPVTLESVPYCPDFNFTADFAVPDTVCQKDTVTALPFKESSVLPISSGWDVTPAVPDNLAADSITFVAEEEGPYTIQHEVSLLGCQDSATQGIHVLGGPTFALPTDTSTCAGDSLLLDSGLDPSLYTLEWQNGDSTQAIWAGTAGVYWLSAVSKATSCENADTTRLSILEKPSTGLPSSASFCEGETLTIEPPEKDLSFRWSTGDTLAALTINQAGTYQLTVTNVQGCRATDSLQAVVLPAPQFRYSPDTTFCPGRPLLLRAEALSEDELQWLWPDGSNSGRFQPGTTGTFPLIVSNAACSDTVFIQVEKGDCRSDVFIPSAFSPNDDGRNDVFKVYGPEIELIRLQIYDRWGGLLYEGESTNAQWDGTFANRPANPGQYVYVLQYLDQLDLEVYQKTGRVLLLR
ncbi:MAG: T9SS type B sorting domain-containing protein [Bacteroidetes bacterium]|jgi:gliding motility-associated-like protein|nr:T9SS type B sorting domain-containing protein [Bacteroidota bacterium]